MAHIDPKKLTELWNAWWKAHGEAPQIGEGEVQQGNPIAILPSNRIASQLEAYNVTAAAPLTEEQAIEGYAEYCFRTRGTSYHASLEPGLANRFRDYLGTLKDAPAGDTTGRKLAALQVNYDNLKTQYDALTGEAQRARDEAAYWKDFAEKLSRGVETPAPLPDGSLPGPGGLRN